MTRSWLSESLSNPSAAVAAPPFSKGGKSWSLHNTTLNESPNSLCALGDFYFGERYDFTQRKAKEMPEKIQRIETV